MNKIIFKHRFLWLRRFSQIGILLLFIGANNWGWNILIGNLSSAYVFETFYISDPFAILQMLLAGFILGTDVLIGGLIILLIYGIIGGRAFCSWVCPMNMVTDAALWLRKKWKLNEIQFHTPINRNIRYWVLFLALILSVFSGVAAFEFVSPVSMLHRGLIFGMGFGWAAVAVIFLFDLLVLKNGWCGHICPIGAFYSIVGKFHWIKVQHTAENCTDCKECFLVCPEPQVLKIIGKESGSINNGECTNCGRCIEVCDDKALKFIKREKIIRRNENE